MSKIIHHLKKRSGRIHYIGDGPKPEKLAPELGDVVWIENEQGKCFGIIVDGLLSEGNLTGKVAFIRPSASHESDGVHLNDQVRIHLDYVWKVVRARLWPGSK